MHCLILYHFEIIDMKFKNNITYDSNSRKILHRNN